MDPTPEETRLGVGGRARAGHRPGGTALDVVVGRAVAAAVVGGLLASFLALALLHRGGAVRQLVAEVGTAVQTAATTLTGDRELDGRGLDGRGLDAAPLLKALLQLRAIERVTWLSDEPGPPLCLTRAGAATAPWQRPGEVPLGQWLGPERFRLARRVAHAGGSDSVLVIEGSLEQAVRREAENVAQAARVFSLVVLLTLCLAPWLGRCVAAPWVRAIGAHHERVRGVGAFSLDTALDVEQLAMVGRVVPATDAIKASETSSAAVRVLVVDDNDTNRQFVRYLLTKRGYAVEVAVDGQSALDAFTLGEYDVVLMDCQMPGMDGFEATRRMRVLERVRARRTPILAMSAGTFRSEVQACRDAGMDDHIGKPFQPKELLAWLEVWVASALHDARGAVGEAPRPRVTEREAGLVPRMDGARPPPSPEGAVDENVLGPLLVADGGRSLAEELVAFFSTSGPETMSSLERRLEAGELDEVARIAHRFVSTSGSVGAVRLARILREVERACSRQRKDEASVLLARASGELAVAKKVLKRRFASPSDVGDVLPGSE